MTAAIGAGRYFGLVLILSLPFYGLGVTGAALPFASALPLSATMAIVPTVSAIVLIYRHGGLDGVKTFLTNAFNFGRVPGAGWIMAAVFMPFAFFVIAGLVWLSGTSLPSLQLLPDSIIFVAFVMFLSGAVGEELGWQGYAYPALVNRHSALTAALVIGIVWALWHVVPFALMGRDAEWIFWQSLGMVLMRIIIVWLFINAGNSILIAVLFHMMSNSVWGVFNNFKSYYDPKIMCAVLFACVLGIVAFFGSTLQRRNQR